MNETEREREKFEEKRTNTRYQKRRLYRRKKKRFFATVASDFCRTQPPRMLDQRFTDLYIIVSNNLFINLLFFSIYLCRELSIYELSISDSLRF